MPETVRIYDAGFVNEIANHPEVGRYLMQDCDFDFSEAIANERHVFLHDSGGIAICSWCAPRVYECHLFFLPDHRGKNAIEATRRMMNHMMENYASALWVQPPIADKATQWLARQCGFVAGDEFIHPQVGPVRYMTKGIA